MSGARSRSTSPCSRTAGPSARRPRVRARVVGGSPRGAGEPGLPPRTRDSRSAVAWPAAGCRPTRTSGWPMARSRPVRRVPRPSSPLHRRGGGGGGHRVAARRTASGGPYTLKSLEGQAQDEMPSRFRRWWAASRLRLSGRHPGSSSRTLPRNR